MTQQPQKPVFLEAELAQSWSDYHFLMTLFPNGIPMTSFTLSSPPYEVFELDWSRLTDEQSKQATEFLQQQPEAKRDFAIPVDYVQGYY